METKANYLMIGGLVVLGVVALAFMFVFWMTNLAGGGKRYYILFDGSVAGLTSGSSVGFNGIKVGEVQSLQLDPTDARKVQVLISVHPGHAGARQLARQHAVARSDRWHRDPNQRRHA